MLPSPDLHVESASPAVDAGNNTYVSTGETDMDAGVRIANSTVDIGADESGSQGCLDSLVFDGVIPSGPYQATDSILSGGLVETTATISYNAPEVLFGPGFEVELGGLLTAEGMACITLP